MSYAGRESNPRPSRYKRAAPTIRAPGALHSHGAHGDIVDWNPRRESNSHPQLRKLALCPLSYEGMAALGAPGRIRTYNRRSRKPVRYPLRYRDFGRSEGVEPIDCGVTDRRVAATPRPPSLVRRRRDSNPQPRVTRRLVSTELQYRSATPPETSTRS